MGHERVSPALLQQSAGIGSIGIVDEVELESIVDIVYCYKFRIESHFDFNPFAGWSIDRIRRYNLHLVTCGIEYGSIEKIQLDIIDANFSHSVDIDCEIEGISGMGIVFEGDYEFAVPAGIAADQHFYVGVWEESGEVVLSVYFRVELEGETVVGEVVIIDLIEREVQDNAGMLR